MFPLFAALLFGQTPSPEGLWLGTIEAGANKLRVVMHVAKAADGSLSAKLDSLDQGAFGIPADSAATTPLGIRVEFTKLRASFEGTFASGGDTLTGQWTQGPNTIPLLLKRSSEAEIAALNPKGKPISDAERKALASQLERTRDLLLQSVQGLSPAQAAFKPAPDKWSCQDVVEHLTVIEDMLFNLASKQLMKTAAKPELAARSAADIKEADAKVHATMVDRTTKAQASPAATPSGRFPSLDAAVAAFKEKRAGVLQYVSTTQDDLRSRGTATAGGLSDAYQYLLMLAAHTERHTLQINEVKASAGFPK